MDGHLDLAYNALGWRRDYRRAARSTRQREAGSYVARGAGQCTVGLPDLVCGHVGVVFGTIFLEPAHHMLGEGPLSYRDPDEAHELGLAQLDFYHRWADTEPHVHVVENQNDLSNVLSAWHLEADSTGMLSTQTASHGEPVPHQVGIVPLLEGADPISEPDELERWVERGLRVVGPAWAGTRYAGGTHEPGGFTRLGRELLEVIAGLHLILDVSHLSQKALFEALEDFQGGPGYLIASHSNPQRIIQTDRHLPDRAIEMIAERRGVIGVVLFNAFLKRGWSAGSKKQEVTLDNVVRAIDHVCQVTGSTDYVGLGSDFDGGFGAESTPRELDTSRDLYRVGDELLRRGFDYVDVQKVMGVNWLRILRNTLPS